jgi:hypothetical protein
MDIMLFQPKLKQLLTKNLAQPNQNFKESKKYTKTACLQLLRFDPIAIFCLNISFSSVFCGILCFYIVINLTPSLSIYSIGTNVENEKIKLYKIHSSLRNILHRRWTIRHIPGDLLTISLKLNKKKSRDEKTKQQWRRMEEICSFFYYFELEIRSTIWQ